MRPGKGGQLAVRPALGPADGKGRQEATLRLPSGEFRMVQIECRATVGQVGNVEHENCDRERRDATVSGPAAPYPGLAMNPVDHPHGGGEGRRPSVCRDR